MTDYTFRECSAELLPDTDECDDDRCYEPCCDDAELTMHAENRRVWEDNNRLRAKVRDRDTALAEARGLLQELVDDTNATATLGWLEAATAWLARRTPEAPNG